MLDAEAGVKESLQLANIEMKEQELLNAEVKNLVALAKAKGVDLKELERFATIVGKQTGAASGPDALRAINTMAQLLRDGVPARKASVIALKEIKNQGANVRRNPSPAGQGQGKGKAEDTFDNLHTQGGLG